MTVPSESRIDTAFRLKHDKYSHFVTDIQSYDVAVIPFEIGSHTGHITTRNKTSLTALHKFMKPAIKLKKFNENVSAITILSSYYIFNCRNIDSWESEAPILAPFPNQ